tara:strand:- start:85 stop:762 length:678 start_codon:yes stop_codon:yes gene_type:complete
MNNNNRKFIIISLILFINSCASLNLDNIAPSYREAFSSIKGAVYGYEDVGLTRQQIDNIPYASAQLKIGKGSKGLVILESSLNKKNTWVSADKAIIVEKEGRIIRTSGLGNNLTFYDSPRQTFKDLLTNQYPILSYFAYYSYDKPKLNSLKVLVEITIKDRQEVEILGRYKSLVLIEEKISNDYINWKKVNRYWVDPETFFVWKSIQFISPKLPEFQIEVTKKPA